MNMSDQKSYYQPDDETIVEDARHLFSTLDKKDLINLVLDSFPLRGPDSIQELLDQQFKR